MEHLTFKAMGTTIHLQIQHEFASYLLDEAKKRLLDYERRFSANNDSSLLMRINQLAGKQPVVVDKDIFELVSIGKKYSLEKECMLNIAIGPLIKLWRIGFTDARVPTQVEIDSCLSIINPNKIILSKTNQSVFLSEKGMEVDLGALAKGFFADKIKHFLMRAGVEKGIIDLGGNVLLIGSHPTNSDALWRVGIQSPFRTRNNIAGLVKLKDVSIVTSGIYERSLQYNGEEYHHIFDSQTGYPIQSDVASITIVSKESLVGEIYTTKLYRYDSKVVLEKLNQLQDIEGIVITRNNEILCSDNLKALFIVNNE